MDPLVSLHYYAPVCAIINLFFLPFVEGLEPFYQLKELGVLVLVSNAAVAFLLNVAAVFLVGVASSLVLTLSGVFKVRFGCHFCFPLLFQVSTWILTGITCRSLWIFYCYIFRDGNTCHKVHVGVTLFYKSPALWCLYGNIRYRLFMSTTISFYLRSSFPCTFTVTVVDT